MCSDIAIEVKNVGKEFRLFKRPKDRLLQAIFKNKRYYTPFDALKNISFNVKRGETVGIVGRNGSGKSTLLQMICGTLTPSSGEIKVHGRVAALLELGAGFNPEFSGRENVYLNGAIMGLSKTEMDARLDAILAFAEIGDFIDQPVKTYSSGMYVRLAFAVIAHVDADILIIDEALAVGDALFTQKCMRFLRNFKETGTILFVSHDSAAVTNLCEHAVWLNKGEMQAYGSAKDVSEAYLADLFGSKNQQNQFAAPITAVTNWRDPRQDWLNCSNLRNDLEVFAFDANQAGFGKGAARIADVHLSDAQGNGLHWVVGGEMVRLIAQIQVTQDLDSPIVGFYIKDRLGQTLFGDNTYFSYMEEPIAVEGGKLLRVAFEFAMPILPQGDYSIAVAIANGSQEDHEQHHWIHDAILFKSHSSALATGLVGVPMKAIEMTVEDGKEEEEKQPAVESEPCPDHHHKYQYDFDPADHSTAARLCRLVGHDKKVLELGCAAGSMTKVLKEHYNCTITGIEYDATAAELARPYCEALYVADLEKTPASSLTDERFDVVLMADVIEHLRNTEHQLRDVSSLLRPNGQLVISVPNIAHNGILAQLLCGQFNYTRTGILDSTHLRFFTIDSLSSRLTKAGLKIIHTESIDTNQHHPEFAHYWQELSPETHSLLEGNEHGHAYQVIIVAGR